MRTRVFIGLSCIAYLIVVRYIFKLNKERLANTLLIALFIAITLATFFQWGLNTPAGTLALGLIVALSGTLLGSKRMSFIAILLSIALIFIQAIHSSGIYTPSTAHSGEQASYSDAFSYTLILLTLSFTLWLSIRRAEQTLKRARQAEKKLRKQKEILKIQLRQESAKLRANQLKEVQNLYSFAALGQNTAATLHELSNHVTVLSMDIESIQETTKLSVAITEAQESIQQITTMVTKARRQLNSYSPSRKIKPYSVLQATVHDIANLFQEKNVKLTVNYLESFDKQLRISCDPLALSHCTLILIKNALDACVDLPSPEVLVQISQTKKLLRITVSDNGVGIPNTLLPRLFTPIASTKPSGLGAGLFIARNLAKTQLQGSLHLTSNAKENLQKGHLRGATFSIDIPLPRSENNE